MLAAVDFDHQLGLAAGEVGDVGADRELSRELWAVAGEDVPDFAFFGRRVGAEGAGSLGEFGVYALGHLVAFVP